MMRWFRAKKSQDEDDLRLTAMRGRVRGHFREIAASLQEVPNNWEREAGYARLVEARDWFLRAAEEDNQR